MFVGRNRLSGNWEEYSTQSRQFYEGSVPYMLERHLKARPWHVFLDVGCGDGDLLYSLDREGWLKDKETLAVDISEKRVEAVRGINKAFRCYVDDACKLANIKDESVDVVASLQVIEHVPDDESMIEQLRRVLTQDGIAYVTTVFKKRGARYIYRNAEGESVIDPTHLREYKDDHLLELFRKHGFDIVENKKFPTMKPILGFLVLGRLSADRDLLTKHPSLRALRRLRFPVPGYYHWEILARRRAKT